MRDVIEAKGTNGRLTFDGVLVTIERGGARAWLRGTGIRSIPARAIVAVEMKPAGLGRGWINFEVERDEDDNDLDDEIDEDDDDGGRAEGLAGLVGWTVRSARARRAEKAERFDPAKDPNTVIFTRGNQLAFEDVRRAVKAARWHASRMVDDDDGYDEDDDEYDEDGYEDDGDRTPTRPLPANDPVRELRQLGQLLQDGVLDRAEFERAKARLLDRI